MRSSGEERTGSVLILGAESDPIVDRVHSIDLVLAGKGGGHVVIGVSIGRGASSLEPGEAVLDAVVPNGVLVLAAFSVRELGNLYSLLIPVCTAAAVGSSAILIARADSNTGIEVPVCEAVMRGWKAVLTVEGRAIRWDDTTDLVGTPITDDLTTGLLQKISMTRVKASATYVTILALAVLVASVSSSSDLTVVVAGRIHVPIAASELSRLGILGPRSSTFIWVGGGRSVDWFHAYTHVYSVDDLDIIEINELLG